MLRVLLIAVLVHGLVPGIGEVVETIIHRVATGHFAHVAGDVHDDEQNAEHGCGATAHRCGCCVNLPMLAIARVELAERGPRALGALPAPDAAPSDELVIVHFRPPIS